MELLANTPEIILYQLINPFTFVPGIVIGWLARTHTQRVVGAVAITAAITLLSLFEELPQGAQRIWGAIPLSVIAPLIWVFAVAALKHWMRPGADAAPRAGRIRFVGAVIGTVLGAPLGAAIGIGIGLAAVEIYEISAREGGAGYFVMFLFFPPGLLIGAITGAVLGYRWSIRRKTPGT